MTLPDWGERKRNDCRFERSDGGTDMFELIWIFSDKKAWGYDDYECLLYNARNYAKICAEDEWDDANKIECMYDFAY